MTNPRLGVDLAGHDLRNTPQGDLALMEDIENVRYAIYRRLETPLRSLFAHPDYGNPVHDLLSEPMDQTWQGKAIAGIRECLAQEPRITVLKVVVDIDIENRKAVFSISYAVMGIPRADNLVWQVNLVA